MGLAVVEQTGAVADVAGGAGPANPSFGVKVFYSLGQVAQSGGFDTALGFVFFYYSAVLGLSGTLVGAALGISLCFDAVIDPLVGSWSDNIRSRLGRRLPLMLLSAPLMLLSIGLLFAPVAGLSQPLLFAWLTVTCVAVRSFISLFNVPYFALGGELADGYTERSSVVAYRATAGVVAGVLVTALAFSVFFAGNGGLQRASAYPSFGWTIGGLLFVVALACSFGVRRYAASLPQPAVSEAALWRRITGEVGEIFRNPSFRMLFFSLVVFYVAFGVNATLNSHAAVFVWKLRPATMQILGYAYLGGILAGITLSPMLARRFEKKTMVLIGVGMVMIVWTAIPSLRAFGLFTATGDATLIPLALNGVFVGIGAGFCAIAYPSMMADAADEHELLKGHRREGLYFAGLGFAGKAATGLGAIVGGLVLDLIGFPNDAAHHTAAITEPVLARLMLAHGPLAAVLALGSVAIFLPYAITRARHDQISTRLRLQRATAFAPPDGVSPGA